VEIFGFGCGAAQIAHFCGIFYFKRLLPSGFQLISDHSSPKGKNKTY
jgi:hypothetical protein